MKNDKGSWVGVQAQPVYQTYQTAGMLTPAAPPPPPTTQAPPIASPVPPVPPQGPIETVPGFPGTGGVFPEMGQPLPPVSASETPQDRLAAAIMGATFGGGTRRNSAKV